MSSFLTEYYTIEFPVWC